MEIFIVSNWRLFNLQKLKCSEGSILAPLLSQVLTMATLTVQYHKRMGEMEGETISCPLKAKPLTNHLDYDLCYFRENVMCWS